MRRPPPLRRIVHANQVGAEDRDLAVHQPLRHVGRDVRPLLREPRLAPVLVAAGPADGRRTWTDLLAGFPLRGFEIRDAYRLAVLLVREVEEVAGQHQLLQRDLLDRRAVLYEMPRHVEMRAAMLRH